MAANQVHQSRFGALVFGFVLFFFIFFVVGVLRGCVVQQKDSFVEHVAGNSVAIVVWPDTLWLSAGCKNNATVTFDVNANRIHEGALSGAASEYAVGVNLLRDEYSDAVLAFLGGGAAWKVSDIGKTLGKGESSPWQVFGGMLGAVSGYSAGVAIGTGIDRCASPGVNAKLHSVEFWRRVERRSWRASVMGGSGTEEEAEILRVRGFGVAMAKLVHCAETCNVDSLSRLGQDMFRVSEISTDSLGIALAISRQLDIRLREKEMQDRLSRAIPYGAESSTAISILKLHAEASLNDAIRTAAQGAASLENTGVAEATEEITGGAMDFNGKLREFSDCVKRAELVDYDFTSTDFRIAFSTAAATLYKLHIAESRRFALAYLRRMIQEQGSVAVALGVRVM